MNNIGVVWESNYNSPKKSMICPIQFFDLDFLFLCVCWFNNGVNYRLKAVEDGRGQIKPQMLSAVSTTKLWYCSSTSSGLCLKSLYVSFCASLLFFMPFEYSSIYTFSSVFLFLKVAALRKCLRRSYEQRMSWECNDMFALPNWGQYNRTVNSSMRQKETEQRCAE